MSNKDAASPAKGKGLIVLGNEAREKYALRQADGSKQVLKLPLDCLAVHVENRSGLFPSPTRVQSLMCEILLKGFSLAEANHEGVCIQELPCNQWEHYQRLHKVPHKTYISYNVEKTASVAALKCAFGDQSTCIYGTVSHSTLLVGLLCLKNGAVWSLLPEHQGKGLEELQTGPDGAWSPEAIARFSPELGQVFKNGISFEVLPWKIMFEEGPGKVASISAALNDPQGLGLTSHEMECFVSILRSVDSQLQQAGRLSGDVDYWTTVQDCHMGHPEHVASPAFKEMFNLVINIGGSAGGFVDLLLDFDRRYVDHKKRHLSPNTWAFVNRLSQELPRTKVALIMRSYIKAKPGHPGLPEPGWENISFLPAVAGATLDLFPEYVGVRSRGPRSRGGSTAPGECLLASD